MEYRARSNVLSHQILLLRTNSEQVRSITIVAHLHGIDIDVDLYGTSFWHSHYSAQYTGGIVGAMVIYGPHENADYDDDLGPIIVEDWYHEDYYDLVEQAMAPISKGLGPPVSTNNLINGKMNV